MDSDGDEDLQKRPRSAQEELIHKALEEENERKKTRKAQKDGAVPKEKAGRTLQEIEVG